MAEQNPVPDPAQSSQSQSNGVPGAPGSPPPAVEETVRRGRRWPKVLGGVLLLIVLLVVFAPSIASTGPMRSLILNGVNDDLEGKIEIADWSIGWNSGITVDGLKLLDQ